MLLPELESRRFQADDTSIRTAVEHYLRNPIKATKIYGPISSWDVSRVTNMRGMFSFADSFNGDLSNWDVSQVTNMRNMFSFAKSFNGDISNWDVSQVTDMSGMFKGASSFNPDNAPWCDEDCFR